MFITHGLSRSSEYQVWNGMRKRCHNPKNMRYVDYGGRGIYVCDEWRQSFASFFADMGPRPAGTTLDRIDNDGPYCAANCRWATDAQQRENKRRPKRYVNNTSGLRGISVISAGGYLVQMSVKGKQVRLGSTRDFFEACCLVKSAEAKTLK